MRLCTAEAEFRTLQCRIAQPFWCLWGDLELESVFPWGLRAGWDAQAAARHSGSPGKWNDGKHSWSAGKSAHLFLFPTGQGQTNQVLLVAFIFGVVLSGLVLAKGKTEQSFKVQVWAAEGSPGIPSIPMSAQQAAQQKPISHSHPQKMSRRRLSLLSPGLQTASDGSWEASKLLLVISILKMFFQCWVPVGRSQPHSLYNSWKAGRSQEQLLPL